MLVSTDLEDRGIGAKGQQGKSKFGSPSLTGDKEKAILKPHFIEIRLLGICHRPVWFPKAGMREFYLGIWGYDLH